jgi:hypothetical protein
VQEAPRQPFGPLLFVPVHAPALLRPRLSDARRAIR